MADNADGLNGHGSCSICGKEAVIFRSHEGRALCRRHFFSSLEKVFRKNIRMAGALPRGANAAILVDGGASSMFLLYMFRKLAVMRQDIKIICLIEDDGSAGKCAKIEKRCDACQSFGFEIFVADDGVPKAMSAGAKAAELGCGRLFVADTLDDVARDIAVGCFGVERDNAGDCAQADKCASIIKPLYNIKRAEIELFSRLKGIEYIEADPHGKKDTFDERISNIISELDERHPGILHNILNYSAILESRVTGA